MAVADHIDKIIVNGTELSINDTNARAMLAPQYADLTFPVAKGQHCIHINDLCEANQDISTSEAWTAAHWDVVTVGYEIEYIGEKMAEMGDDITSIGNDVDDLGFSVVDGKLCVTYDA